MVVSTEALLHSPEENGTRNEKYLSAHIPNEKNINKIGYVIPTAKKQFIVNYFNSFLKAMVSISVSTFFPL